MRKKKDISYLQVKSTADRLSLSGAKPTIKRMYALLGDIGTKEQIAAYLRQWHKEKAQTQKKEKKLLTPKEVEKIIAVRTQELQKSLSLVRATLESTEDGILIMDNDGNLVDFNKKLVEISTLPKKFIEKGNESDAMEYIFTQLENPEELFQLIMHLQQNPAEKGPMGEVRLKNGHLVERYTQPQMLEDNIVGRVWSFRDVTEQRKNEEALRLRQRAIEASSHGVAIIENTAEKNIIYANQALTKISGFSSKDLLKNNLAFFKGPPENEAEWRGILFAMNENRKGRGILRNYRKNGDPFWNEFSIASVPNPEGIVTHFVAIIEDITEQKALEEQLIHQATHDSLTDLPNRLLLVDRIRQMILSSGRYKTKASVLFLDLDRFKLVNDSLGHRMGDDLLTVISHRLQSCLRDSDTVARIGGDEFVIMLAPITKEEDAIGICNKILKTVSKPLRIGSQELNITTSIGVSCFPQDGDDADTLIRNADTAMYQAKEEGRNKFKFYAMHMNKRVMKQLQIENSLHKALTRQEFYLKYQPIIDLKTKKPVAAEALIRWHHPTLGEIAPLEFVHIAEESGLIIPIGHWVLQTACERNMAWIKQGLPPIEISVNLSARQLKQGNIVEVVQNVLTKTKLPPALLSLELTESILMEGTQEMIEILTQLKNLGVKLAIDDFGTGYSSLSYLKFFPIDKIKIDKTFIRDIGSDPDDVAIILAIVAMAKSLGLVVIAEGAETQAEVDFLANNQCDQLQGYFFSPPIDEAHCTQLLETTTPPAEDHI